MATSTHHDKNMAAKLKKGDQVIVLTGKDKGQVGEIVKLFPTKERAIVAGVNKVKRHNKPNQFSAGGIEEKEASIHLSNIAYYQDGKATRIGFTTLKDGTKARVAKRSGETISE